MYATQKAFLSHPSLSLSRLSCPLTQPFLLSLPVYFEMCFKLQVFTIVLLGVFFRSCSTAPEEFLDRPGRIVHGEAAQAGKRTQLVADLAKAMGSLLWVSSIPDFWEPWLHLPCTKKLCYYAGKFKYQAGLTFGTWSSMVFCGGTFIDTAGNVASNENIPERAWVLTAGHCARGM